MSKLLSILCFWVSLTFPLALLTIRFLRPRWMPWWLLLPGVMVVGWIMVNVGLHFHYDHLAAVLRATPNPSGELIRKVTADGAPRLLALLLGWAYGLIYLIPWLLVYGFCRLMKRICAGPGAPP
jgi:hypothetical protein